MKTKVGKETPMHSMLKRSLDLTLNLSFLPPPPFFPPLFHPRDGFLTLINGTWCLNFKKKSWSKEDGTCAVNNHHWDPRSQHVAETSEEWIILNSTL